MEDLLSTAAVSFAGLVGSGIVALGALAGVFAGFVYKEHARRQDYRAQLLSDADAAIATVQAARQPITSVDLPEWSLSAD